MTAGAIITMVLVQSTVTIVTIYFFFKVLRTPPKTETQKAEENSE